MPENLVSRDGFSRPVPRQPAHLHTQAESGAYLRVSSRVPRRRPFMKPSYAIGSVPSLSGHAIAYRWRSLTRVRRHRANKPQGSSERVLPWQVTMDQLICAPLSHSHYWYEVGMLKVPLRSERVSFPRGIRRERFRTEANHILIWSSCCQVVQLMLHAPAAMWAALDSGRVLEAANLLLRCRICWEDVSTSVSVGMDSSLAAFLRSHHTYVEQFPQRIVAAGTRLLTRSRNTEETARALAALLQLQAVKEESPLR